MLVIILTNYKTMKPCWCGLVLGILVVVFAWWQVDWGYLALTIIGIIVAIKSCMGKCCCEAKKSEAKK